MSTNPFPSSQTFPPQSSGWSRSRSPNIGDARYQQAGELAADLALATKTDTATETAAPAVTAVATDPPAQRVPSDAARKLRPSLILIAGILFGAIVLVGGVVVGGRLVGGSDDETASPQTQPTEVIEVAASEVAPPTSVAGARPEPTTAPVPESEPVSAVVIRDSSLEAQLPGVNTPAAGQSYHAWLLGGESVEPLHLNRDGTVDLLGNELIISFAHPDGVNLLSQYEQFVVSLRRGMQPANPTFCSRICRRL